MGVEQKADEADDDERARLVGGERVKGPSSSMTLIQSTA